jgi:hypothetical protein
MKLIKIITIVLSVILISCSGGGGGGSGGSSASSAVFTANLNSASTAGVANQSGTTVAFLKQESILDKIERMLGMSVAVAQSASNTVQSSIAVGDFVSIDGRGNIARIFNYSFPIFGIKETTNYLLVSGNFQSPNISHTSTPAIVDANGNALNCYLFAIKKTATGQNSDVTCLSTVQVGSYSISLSSTNSHYAHLGLATRGTTAYYTDWVNGKLYKWTEGASSGSMIFAQTPVANIVGMDDVFIDAAGANICVLYSALSLGFGSVYYGNIYCGTDAGINATLIGDVNNEILAETRLLSKYILAGTKKIDLTNLSVTTVNSNGSNYGLPSGNSNIFVTNNGASIYRSYGFTLSYMDTTGNTCALAYPSLMANTNCAIAQAAIISSYFQTVLGLGSYTWAYGTSNANDTTTGNYLAKVNNTTLVLDVTNYLGTTGLSTINDMSYTIDGKIVVSGLDGSGNTKYAYIDSLGNITASSIAPLFRLSQSVSL